MDFAPAYLIERFFYRIADFFHHWYVDGSRAIGRRFTGTLENADRSLALKITLRDFFHPYGNHTMVGRAAGVIFRAGKIMVGLVAYAAITFFFLTFYLAWLATPAVIIFYAVRGL